MSRERESWKSVTVRVVQTQPQAGVVTGATGSFLGLFVAIRFIAIQGQDKSNSGDKAGSGDNAEVRARDMNECIDLQ